MRKQLESTAWTTSPMLQEFVEFLVGYAAGYAYLKPEKIIDKI